MEKIAAQFIADDLRFYSLTDDQAIVVSPNGFAMG